MSYDNIITGPCAVETRGQLFKTYDELYELGFRFFRGGVWKPRTKPGGFEGHGEQALIWMKEYKDLHPDVKICCEIANATQTKLALKYNLDAIWIGARTTTDPFAVQEIADVLAGTWPGKEDLMVFIKNPPCPDIELWDGAIQRIQRSGINKIIAIHRGFKVYNDSKYRNDPIWRIPLELKIKYPDIPIYIDPSHIAGKREYIEELLYSGINVYNFDGAMIESHFDPDNAWTDAKQQFKPSDLKEVVDKVFSYVNDSNKLLPGPYYLEDLRKKIDYIDTCLIFSLAERLKLSQMIGEYKKEAHMKTFQPDRWNSLLNQVISFGKEHGLDENYIRDIWTIIHEKSIEVQN